MLLILLLILLLVLYESVSPAILTT